MIPGWEKQYGAKIHYLEDYNDNEEFYAKVRQELEAGRGIGRDLVTPTDWMAGRWIDLGYATPIDKKNVPNEKNLQDSLKHPPFDKNRDFTLPWQSGITGIGYNPKKTGRKLTSVNDLYDPAFKGRVSMFTEWRDTAGLVLLGQGKNPTTATKDDYSAAIAKIDEENKKGQIRKFTGNDYTKDLAAGNLWACVAWSGDLVQLKADNPNLEFLVPEEGAMTWSDNMLIPQKPSTAYGAETFMNYVYDPQVAAVIAAYVNYFCPGQGREGGARGEEPRAREQPADLPGRGDPEAAVFLPEPRRGTRARAHRRDAEGHRGVSTAGASAAPKAGGGWLTLRRRRALLPVMFIAPGLIWLIVFYAIPIVSQLWVSLQTGNPDDGFAQTWNWSVYPDSISEYSDQLVRSIEYAGTATILCLIISFPLAYFIAFKAGRWKNVMLLLIILPFFTSLIVRTVAWQTILTDDGWIVNAFQTLGLLDANGRLLATRTAVIAGITYNFLPFMALPLYASLERLDRRLIEAATDLYASRWTAFRKVTLPLAAPGIFAGTLLTFIPAIGDYINAQLLGTSQNYMIGNVIQSQYLVVRDYPTAAALSFVLMVGVLIVIGVAARALGLRRLSEAAAA